MPKNRKNCYLVWLGPLFLSLAQVGMAQEAEWPQQVTRNGSVLVTYQPQVDDWKNFTELDWRAAFSLTPPGGKPAMGVVSMHGQTDVVPDRDLVVITNLKIKTLHFPSMDEASAAKMDQLFRTLVPPTVAISLRRLTACVPKPESVPSAPLRNDPPPVFVSYRPAILLFVDGQPQLAPVKDTSLEFVVNTSWPLFLDKGKTAYYLLVGQEWLTAVSLQGPWKLTAQLPPDMAKLAGDPEWSTLKSVIPPPANAKPVNPSVFYSTTPAEVLLFDGQPKYSAIPGTQLTYATNTASDVFVHTTKKQYYVLISGRWFRASALAGPWTFATPDLPSDFAGIPSNSPAGRVLVAVPGTDEAKDAVLLAQVPTTFEVDPVAAAAQAKVAYSGDPQFAPIEGTSLSYATNTQDKVIKVGDVYYLCLQGVWFMSTTAQGPWTTASSVPQEIYSIPPSAPVYNVTYVTQTTSSSGTVTASHTAGYMGAFVVGMTVGAIVANGSGYYYPPYVYRPPYGYPIYHPYPVTYGTVHHYHTWNGAYGVSRSVYGPYGSATRAASYNPYTGTYARGASVSTPYGTRSAARAYNPYTGTAARGASVSTPYGSRSAAQAYNPYTGRYAATAQGSSPGAQWGTSVVTRGNQSAITQHYSTAQGTVATARTSSGGQAAAVRGAGGSATVARSGSGDVYAGKDGNVYRNTGSGWQKYESGGWSTVTPPSSASPQSSARAAGTQRAAVTGGATATTQTSSTSVQQRTPSSQPQRTTTPQRPSASGEIAASGSSRSSGAHPTQELNQERQSRQRGAAQSQQYQRGSGGGRSYSGARRR
jgi:hypothetical protein